jgi:hypothetical protein
VKQDCPDCADQLVCQRYDDDAIWPALEQGFKHKPINKALRTVKCPHDRVWLNSYKCKESLPKTIVQGKNSVTIFTRVTTEIEMIARPMASPGQAQCTLSSSKLSVRRIARPRKLITKKG